MSTEKAAGPAAGQRRLRPARRLVAAVAAVVVVAAGGTYLGVRLSSGTGPATSGLATKWTQDALATTGTRHVEVTNCPDRDMGTWVTNGLAVICGGNGVLAAYRLGTGHVAWTWHAPSAHGALPEIFQMTPSTDEGIGVLEYGYGTGTLGIVGLDMTTGRQLWLLPPSALPSPYVGIWEGDGRFDIVTASHSGSGISLQVYDLATGVLDWSSGPRGIPPSGCELQDAAITGPWVYAVTHCSGGADRLYQLSLPTGSVIAQAVLQDGPCKASSGYPTLWAVSGYVLSGCDDTAPDILIIPAGGVLQRVLRWTGTNGSIRSLSEALSQTGVAISGSTLYVGTSSSSGGDQIAATDQIAAIDLGTARLRWYKTISIPGELGSNLTLPQSMVGADPKGVIDVIESLATASGGDSVITGITLALLSASDGSISYGPGTAYPPGVADQPAFRLADGILLSFADCPGACAGKPTRTTAYSLGSWPA